LSGSGEEGMQGRGEGKRSERRRPESRNCGKLQRIKDTIEIF